MRCLNLLGWKRNLSKQITLLQFLIVLGLLHTLNRSEIVGSDVLADTNHPIQPFISIGIPCSVKVLTAGQLWRRSLLVTVRACTFPSALRLLTCPHTNIVAANPPSSRSSIIAVVWLYVCLRRAISSSQPNIKPARWLWDPYRAIPTSRKCGFLLTQST